MQKIRHIICTLLLVGACVWVARTPSVQAQITRLFTRADTSIMSLWSHQPAETSADDAGANAQPSDTQAGEKNSTADDVPQEAVDAELVAQFNRSYLSQAQQDIYDQLLAGLTGAQEQFSIRVDDKDDIEPAYRSVVADHPEFFWLDGSCTYQIDGVAGLLGAVKIVPGFNVDASSTEDIQQKIDAQEGAFLAQVPSDASTYDKVKAAYEWVILNTDYVEGASQNQNIQSVFLTHASVCAGYAKAFKYLLDRMGIPCAYIEGVTASGEPHAWVMVDIDNTWTYCDPTWGDPQYQGDSSSFSYGDILYDYLCLTIQEIEALGHVATHQDALMSCTSSRYDYYKLAGRELDTYDTDAISALFWAAVDDGEDSLALKFSQEDAYQQARSAMDDHVFFER
ncbi:MAG: transglutaminase domain-containing protein [Atopobiaceae bacterium]|jgi:hypothetical protein